MEDTALSLFLFVFIYSSLCYLYSGSKSCSLITDNIPETETKAIEPKETTPPPEEDKLEQTPIIEKSPPLEPLIEGIEIDNITAIAARKIASRLQIKQTVNRKKRSRASLLEDIEKELKANPVKIAPIINSLMA